MLTRQVVVRLQAPLVAFVEALRERAYDSSDMTLHRSHSNRNRPFRTMGWEPRRLETGRQVDEQEHAQGVTDEMVQLAVHVHAKEQH